MIDGFSISTSCDVDGCPEAASKFRGYGIGRENYCVAHYTARVGSRAASPPRPNLGRAPVELPIGSVSVAPAPPAASRPPTTPMPVPRSPSGRKKASAVVVNPEAVAAFAAALEGRGWTPLAELQAILGERHPDRSWTENAAGRVARAAIKAKKVAVVDIRRFHYYAPIGFSGALPETNEGRVLRAVAAGHRSARDIAAYIHGGPMAIAAAVANLVAANKLKKGPRGQCYLATEEIPVPPELVAALDTLKSLPRPASAPHLAMLAGCDRGTMLRRMHALHDLGLVVSIPTTKGDEWTPAKLETP